MSARIDFVLSAAIAAAICSVGQSIPAQAEPSKGAAAAHASEDASRSWKTSARVFVANGSNAHRSPVASATHKLDLSKLTLADFGDLDQSR